MLLPGIVMALLFLTAFLKLADLREFDHALSTWTLVPTWARRVLVVAVPAVELAISLLYILGVCRRRVALAAIGFLVFTAIVYAIHLMIDQRPNCGCAGVLKEYEWARFEGYSLIVRNSLLAACCFPAIRRSRMEISTNRVSQPNPGTTRGFTLLELLIVIAITSILLAIFIPSVSRFRDASRQAKSLSYLRSHASSVAAYSAQSRDHYPYFGNPTGPISVQLSGCEFNMNLYYFFLAYYWHIAFPEMQMGTNKSTLSSPGSRGSHCGSTYLFSSSLRARPEFWNPTTRMGPDQWLSVRTDETLFPSSKVMFKTWDYVNERALGRAEVAACDGHAAVIRADQMITGYPSGEGFWPGSWFIRHEYGMHTIDGVRGRDITPSR
jgi:prepilin-type N-terminal cleavage/methylation domain-containing protein